MSDEIENKIKLAAETLTGDVRDALLTHVRAMEDPWSKLSEDKQQTVINAITNTARHLVARSLKIIATQGLEQIGVEIGKWTVKDGIKLEVKARETVDNMTKLAENTAKIGILVLADLEQFDGERSAANPDPDEPELPMEDTQVYEDAEFEEVEEEDIEETGHEFPAIPASLDRRDQPEANA